MGVAEDTDRAVARWALGEAAATATLEALLATLERAGAFAAVVPRQGDATLAARSRRARAGLLAIAARAGERRLFATAAEEGFLDLLGGAEAGAGATWLASEPFGNVPEAAGALVVVGLTAAPDELLVALPRVARAVGVVVARTASDGNAWKVTHALNNLLAGAVANAGYAASLIEGLAGGGVLDEADRRDVVQAIENTRDGVSKMAASMKALTATAKRPDR
ncbi:MAG: hypothetical protein JWP97_2742 [Labilithrix sp.]|nr:hypothetical protein [Labilithrix sp.]